MALDVSRAAAEPGFGKGTLTVPAEVKSAARVLLEYLDPDEPYKVMVKERRPPLVQRETYSPRKSRGERKRVASSGVRAFRVRGKYAKKRLYMPRSGERDKAEEALYKVGARYYRLLRIPTQRLQEEDRGRLSRAKGTVKAE